MEQDVSDEGECSFGRSKVATRGRRSPYRYKHIYNGLFVSVFLVQGNNRSLPVTARSLETLIRLASAHAKARLSHKVEESDASKAVDLMSFALYHETASSLLEQHDENADTDDGDALRKSTRQRKQDGPASDDGDEGNARYVSDADYTIARFRFSMRATTLLVTCLRQRCIKGMLLCALSTLIIVIQSSTSKFRADHFLL